MIVAGGSEAAIIPVGLGGFVACRALSTNNDDPAGVRSRTPATRLGHIAPLAQLGGGLWSD
jgi:3-oxoacyl-[acyl-carrier-protein] synthase II